MSWPDIVQYLHICTPFCPVHWPWCRLSILYVMCTFEVDWSWVALLSKLMDTLTANIYEMRQVRSANYSTLDGWPLLLHLTRNYRRVNILLSYLIGKSRAQNLENTEKLLRISATRIFHNGPTHLVLLYVKIYSTVLW